MNPEENAYLKAASYFLKRAANLIAGDLDDDNAYVAIFLFGIGVERLFHAILHDLNPAFVLKTFKPELAILRGVAARSQSGQVYPNDDELVLSMREALELIVKFSNAAQSHKTTLIKLKNYRNIVAHRPLDELKPRVAAEFCQTMFIPIVGSFSTEIDLDPELHFFDGKLESLKIVRMKVEALLRFEEGFLATGAIEEDLGKTKKDEDGYRDAVKDTRDVCAKPGQNIWIPCPICGNPAVLSYTGLQVGPPLAADSLYSGALYGPGFPIVPGGPTLHYQRGAGGRPEANHLHCHFCGLDLKADENAQEMDAFKVQDALDMSNVFDPPPPQFREYSEVSKS